MASVVARDSLHGQGAKPMGSRSKTEPRAATVARVALVLPQMEPSRHPTSSNRYKHLIQSDTLVDTSGMASLLGVATKAPKA